MKAARSSRLRTVLAVSAVAEAATGLLLLIDPGIVVALLLGVDAVAEVVALGRVAGIALLALGLACWPGTGAAGETRAALRAMLAYNLLVALYLVYLATAARLGGPLLWPAVAAHGVVTLLLVAGRGDERPMPRGSPS
jgi:hypothetical protein